MKNRVRCGPIPPGACASREPFNGQAYCRHLGCGEIDPRAVKSLGVSFSPIKLASNLRAREPIWGARSDAFNLFAPLRVLLVEHWLKQLCERHVKSVDSPHYSITSSARASSDAGMVRPSALAVFR